MHIYVYLCISVYIYVCLCVCARRSWTDHERFELTFSNVLVALDALSLCFTTFPGLRTLSTYACAAKSSKAK